MRDPSMNTALRGFCTAAKQELRAMGNEIEEKSIPCIDKHSSHIRFLISQEVDVLNVRIISGI